MRQLDLPHGAGNNDNQGTCTEVGFSPGFLLRCPCRTHTAPSTPQPVLFSYFQQVVGLPGHRCPVPKLRLLCVGVRGRALAATGPSAPSLECPLPALLLPCCSRHPQSELPSLVHQAPEQKADELITRAVRLGLRGT